MCVVGTENSASASPLRGQQPRSPSCPLPQGPLPAVPIASRLPPTPRHQPAATFSPPLTCHLPSPPPSRLTGPIPALPIFFFPSAHRCQTLSLFLSPHFPPRHVLLGAQFPCAQLSRFLPPSQKKRKKGHFPASLEPWDVPLPPAAWAHPLLHAPSGERGAGTGGAAAGGGTAGCRQVSGATADSKGVPHGVLPTPAHAWWQLPILRRAAPEREGGFWGHVRAEERSGRA